MDDFLDEDEKAEAARSSVGAAPTLDTFGAAVCFLFRTALHLQRMQSSDVAFSITSIRPVGQTTTGAAAVTHRTALHPRPTHHHVH